MTQRDEHGDPLEHASCDEAAAGGDDGADAPDARIDDAEQPVRSPRTGFPGLLDRGGVLVIKTIVYTYRFTLSPFIGGQCRFYPTCSQYMLDAVAKYGPWRGGWKGVKRVCRCHPFGGSGFDPA